MIVPQVKNTPFFARFQVPVSSTFAAILTPFLHENRYKLQVKNNLFFGISSTLYKITPLFYTFKNTQKLLFFYYLHPSLIEKVIRGRVKNSLQPSFFSSHECIYTKVAVPTSSMNLCLVMPRNMNSVACLVALKTYA